MKYDLENLTSYLAEERLTSYLASADGDLSAALRLYAWNGRVSSSLFEDLGRLEVVFRNALHSAASAHHSDGESEWFEDSRYFQGKTGERSLQAIEKARRQASNKRKRQPVPGDVISELNLGFWRFLSDKSYLTTLWVPALHKAFPHHPTGVAHQVRADVESRVSHLHFLRNRIAHHEPIHQRRLSVDIESIDTLLGWISADAAAWSADLSRTAEILESQPQTSS